jgi:hypothetical protein
MGLTIEFFRTNGTALTLLDLGPDFLITLGIDPNNAARPFRIGVDSRKSKAGNEYFEYSQNGVPLPEGLSTFLKVNGVIIPMGSTKPSLKGNPTREGITNLLIGSVIYSVTAYLTETKGGYYIKVIAHKRPDSQKALQKAQRVPRGGSILP